MIKKEEVERVAKLARIELDEEEIKKFQKDFSGILDHFNLLNKVNVSKIKPTFHPSEEFLKKEEAMREDMVASENPETVDKLIEAIPDKKDKYIKVKAIFNELG
jgi:aspartyl-tRNA(Asn)/glutamyl-tRNA(Gln) amidotransferase subunit C